MAVEFNADNLITPVAREDLFDGFLRLLVGTVNKFGVEIPVVLHTHGMLVSGVIIANSNFFKEIGGKVASSTPNTEVTKAIASIFEQWQKHYEEDNAADKENFTDRVTFIHLRDAQFFVPGQNPIPTQPTHWRAKLSEISGFSLGQLGVGGPN